jgi:hypothetical protein
MRQRGPKLTEDEKLARDLRMQACLNFLRMERVYRAAQEHGWVTIPWRDFETYAWIFDYPTRVEFAYPETADDDGQPLTFGLYSFVELAEWGDVRARRRGDFSAGG